MPEVASRRGAVERLRRRAEFDLAMRKGRRSGDSLVQVVARTTDGPVTRLGFSVSGKVGGAVVRNRLKRRLREIVRGLPWREGFDVVIIARPGSDTAGFEVLARSVTAHARRQHLLADEDA